MRVEKEKFDVACIEMEGTYCMGKRGWCCNNPEGATVNRRVGTPTERHHANDEI
jgi:hypothetical protein